LHQFGILPGLARVHLAQPTSGGRRRDFRDISQGAAHQQLRRLGLAIVSMNAPRHSTNMLSARPRQRPVRPAVRKATLA
jgi:hypothetical protein